MKLCFRSEELQARFFEHVSIYEARLLLTTLTNSPHFEPGIYNTQFPRIGVGQRGSCVRIALSLDGNDFPLVLDLEVLHRGGIKGLWYSTSGWLGQFVENIKHPRW